MTAAQRRRIAAGKLAGKTNRQLGAELDLHPETIGRQSHDVRTTTAILRLKERSDADFARMWLAMMGRLENDLKSKDFSERHAARTFLLRALTAGDPPLHRVGDVGSSDGDFTLEELLYTMRTVTRRAS